MESFKLDLPREVDGVLSNREHPGAADVLGSNREKPVKCLKRIRMCSSKKVTWAVAQLQCLYINACSMGNKQEKLEAIVQLESYDLIANVEIAWLEGVQEGQARRGARQGVCPLCKRTPD